VQPAGSQTGKETNAAPARNMVAIMLEWAAVSIPLVYGFWVTVLQAVKLFK
jgi:hypothetical protein